MNLCWRTEFSKKIYWILKKKSQTHISKHATTHVSTNHLLVNFHQQNSLGMATGVYFKFWAITQFYKFLCLLLKSFFSPCIYIQATLTHTHPGKCPQISYLWAYVILSGWIATSMISFWREVCVSIPRRAFPFLDIFESTHFFPL